MENVQARNFGDYALMRATIENRKREENRQHAADFVHTGAAERMAGEHERACALRDEARTLPPGPRAAACLARLEDICSTHEVTMAAFEGFEVKAADALFDFDRWAGKKSATDAAWLRGSLVAKDAAALFADKVRTDAAFQHHDTAIAALAVPSVPRSLVPTEAINLAIDESAELALHYREHGAQFGEGPRPPVDVVAIARRQGREADADVACFWPIGEERAMRDATQAEREDLERIYASRAGVYQEKITFGDYAR
ncbi:hypothetical protein BH11MYX4_BH11MYX4_41980 [soil metagenome]